MHTPHVISSVYPFSDASMEAACCQFQTDEPDTRENHLKEVQHMHVHAKNNKCRQQTYSDLTE